MSATNIKALLNGGSLIDLTARQRELGREQLPAAFRRQWAERYALSCEVLQQWQTPGPTRDMATLLNAVTCYIGSVEPPNRPNYYQYTDAAILDWYLSSAADVSRLQQLCLDGVLALCDDLRQFEIGFPDRPGQGFDADIDRRSIDRRIDLVTALAAELVATGARRAAPCGPFDTVEQYVKSASRLPAVLHLTALPLTRSHDEYLFLRVLQGSELCFFAIRTCVAAAIEGIKIARPVQAAVDVEHAIVFSGLLSGLLRVLGTMPVHHFASFRYNTGAASAIQSINFQLLDVVLHGVSAGKAPHLGRFDHLKNVVRYGEQGFVSLRAAVQSMPGDSEPWTVLRDICRRLDRSLLTWRGLHLSFAKTYIPNHGPGTGGTSGAGYLRQHLFQGLFDGEEPDWDLIEAIFPAQAAPRVRPGVAIAP